jgi:hypothetical protein
VVLDKRAFARWKGQGVSYGASAAWVHKNLHRGIGFTFVSVFFICWWACHVFLLWVGSGNGSFCLAL